MLYRLSKIINYKVRNYLILSAILGSYLYLTLFPLNNNINTCIIKGVTGIPCPGCGGTRAMDLLLDGKIADSILLNPIAVLIFLFSIVAFFWIIRDIIQSNNSFQILLRKKWNKWYFISVVILILTNWIWNITKGL